MTAVFTLADYNTKEAVEEVEVDSTYPDGVKFVLLKSSSYEIMIIGRAYCYLLQEDQIGQFITAAKILLHRKPYT